VILLFLGRENSAMRGFRQLWMRWGDAAAPRGDLGFRYMTPAAVANGNRAFLKDGTELA
jgi:hypothetical protein